MTCLVKHYLCRARPKNALILSSFMVLMYLGIGYLLPMGGGRLSSMPFAMLMLYGMTTSLILGTEEFDLVLPVRRRTIHLARSLAALLLMAITAAPLCAVAFGVAAIQGGARQAFQFCPALAICWISLPLMGAPFMGLARQTRSVRTRMILGSLPLVVVFPLLMVAVDGRISMAVPAAVSLLGATVGWFLGRRQFERYELIPSGDAGPAQVAAARPGLTDRFPPMARLLAHGVWLKDYYPVMVVLMAGVGFMFTSMMLTVTGMLIFSCVVYAGLCGINVILFKEAAQSLLPFVPRRTILRSVLGPFAATPLLIGCVAAIAAGSAQMIVGGLATALVIVGLTSFMLPSAGAYCWPLGVRLHYGLFFMIVLCIPGWLFVPGFQEVARRPLSEAWPPLTPWVAGNPLLVSCVIILAIALLWWRCERKFEHFEPGAAWRISTDAA